MKNLRRLARLALCFCALLLFLPGRAEAAGGLFGNELAWYLDDEGMLTISAFRISSRQIRDPCTTIFWQPGLCPGKRM